jgi:hypothetical protein
MRQQPEARVTQQSELSVQPVGRVSELKQKILSAKTAQADENVGL